MALLTENSSELRNNIIQVLLKKISVLRQQHDAMYEGSPDLFRTINTNGIILDCNNVYAKYLGYTKDEVIGKSIFDHVSDDGLDHLKNTFESWKRNGHVESREIRLKRKDGSTFVGLLSATNLYDVDGKLIGSNTVIKDVTEIYEARKKLDEDQKIIKDQLDKLQIVGKAKDEFLAMITHELKTPLVPIKAYVDMLLSEKLGALNNSQKGKLDIIRSSTENLLKLVHDLLDAQKLELGQLKLDMQKHSLSDIISDTVLKMKPNAEKYGISLSIDIQKDVLCVCDRYRIEQVLANLIANSIDFVPKQTGRIHLSLISDNGHAKIIVKDNGIGIKKESIGKIFVKFYQVDTTSTREHGGTGLGLAVCKGVVENHGGKIWAESDGEGKGATIHIKLPTTGKQ